MNIVNVTKYLSDVYGVENTEKYNSLKLKRLKELESDIFKDYTSDLSKKFTKWW